MLLKGGSTGLCCLLLAAGLALSGCSSGGADPTGLDNLNPPSDGTSTGGSTSGGTQPGGGTTTPPTTPPLTSRIRVKPVFLVPMDATAPPDAYHGLLMDHLKWAQERYREMLAGMDTFELAVQSPVILNQGHPKAYYTVTTDYGMSIATRQLLNSDHVDRMTCSFVYVTLFVGTDSWPPADGRPINGGLNTGGGIVVMAADALANLPEFQSALEHALGHAFGLVDVSEYGYSMSASPSVMSDDPSHRTRDFEPAPTPAQLIPEDCRALDYAKRLFPSYTVDPARDYPAGYTPAPIVLLAPMTITAQPAYTGPSIVE
jgi:hypothetical protein